MLWEAFKIVDRERELLFHEPVYGNAVCSGIEMGDGSVVSVIAFFRNETIIHIPVSYELPRLRMVPQRGALYLETNFSKSGSRFNGFWTEYSSWER